MAASQTTRVGSHSVGMEGRVRVEKNQETCLVSSQIGSIMPRTSIAPKAPRTRLVQASSLVSERRAPAAEHH